MTTYDDAAGVLYKLLSFVVGLVAFVGSWAYAIERYGWFLGIGLCWIPALFIGIITAYVWPLVLLALAYLFPDATRAVFNSAASAWVTGAVAVAALGWGLVRLALFSVRNPRVARLRALYIFGLALDALGVLSLGPILTVGGLLAFPSQPEPWWTRMAGGAVVVGAIGLVAMVAVRRRRVGRPWYDPTRIAQSRGPGFVWRA